MPQPEPYPRSLLNVLQIFMMAALLVAQYHLWYWSIEWNPYLATVISFTAAFAAIYLCVKTIDLARLAIDIVKAPRKVGTAPSDPSKTAPVQREH